MDKNEGEEQMRHFWNIMTATMLPALVLAGCGAGKAEQTPETVETSAVEETDETSVETAEAQEEAAPGFTYLEEAQIEDTLGDGKEYALYAPKGGLNEDGLFYYQGHGVDFSASVYHNSAEQDWSECLNNKAGQIAEFWEEDLGYSDVNVGDVLQKGDDYYIILTTMAKDNLDTPYHEARLLYMSVRDVGMSVFWDMEVRESAQDEETAALISEVAHCYDLDLNEFVTEDGTWAEQYELNRADLQDVYEPEEGDVVLEKAEGYQYLGRLTLTLDDEGNVTYPVLVPMGWNTETEENAVSTMTHGVYMQVAGSQIDEAASAQELLQEEADDDIKLRKDPEVGNCNAQVSEVMPLPGQDEGAFYILEYEEQNFGSEEYYKTAQITWLIPVQEDYFVVSRIHLISMDYDSNTNKLIKELETAYGFDLSKWYAEE